MQKGWNVTGTRLFEKESFRYHVSHVGNRHVMCGCSKSIKIDGKLRHCMGSRFDKTKKQPVGRSTVNLWYFLNKLK